MTIEQLQSEKRVLKEKIEKAAMEFHDATGLQVSGGFRTEEAPIHDIMGVVLEIRTSPVVIINPIEI